MTSIYQFSHRIKKNIAYVIFCKYSKDMNDLLDPEKNNRKEQQNRQFSQKTVYVRDDDQDWGSSGMNNIQTDSE